MTQAALDQDRLHQLLGKAITELGAAANGVLILLGDRMGLFKALADHGPASPGDLAQATHTDERLVAEWLATQAASGFVTYHEDADTYSLSPEQAAVFADPDSPAAATGGFYGVAAMWADLDRLEQAFRDGKGIAWGDHNNCLFCGTARFFRPGYAANIVQHWLPALDGVVEKLQRGARVADVGCGHGHSTRIIAQAFPNSRVTGYDYHEPSIRTAREEHADVPNLDFAVAAAQELPQEQFDLVCIFDALHDMGDPVGAARAVRRALKDDGTFMLVEPRAGDRLADNLNPIGRCYYAFSTNICVPNAQSQPGGMALGAQAGDARLRAVAEEAGFTRFRRATETPITAVLELRP